MGFVFIKKAARNHYGRLSFYSNLLILKSILLNDVQIYIDKNS